MNNSKDLIIQAGDNNFKITVERKIADTLFVDLVGEVTKYIRDRHSNVMAPEPVKEPTPVFEIPPVDMEKLKERLRLDNAMALSHSFAPSISQVLEEPKTNITTPKKEEAKPNNVQAITNTKGYDLDDRKIRLAIMKCDECGTTSALLVDNYNKPFVCKYCSHETSFQGTVKGRYNCKCGNSATFYMNDTVSTVKCNKCNQEFYMVQQDDSLEYKGVEM